MLDVEAVTRVALQGGAPHGEHVMAQAAAERNRIPSPRARGARRIAAATLAAAALVAAAGTGAEASARWQRVPPVGNYDGGVTNMSLSLAGTARITDGGFGARWQAKIACPAGRAFTLSAHLDQLASPLVPPWVFGEDYGVPADGTVTGTCTRRAQTVTIPLTVGPTRDGEAPGTPKLIPLVARAGYVAHVGEVSGNGFSGSWCRNPACASETPGLSSITLRR